MFSIKICGITRIEDARAAALAGADAIGLNFAAASPRRVEVSVAEMVSLDEQLSIDRVGVFVNADYDELCETARLAKLDYLQLHGDEPAELVVRLRNYRVIKAFRLKEFELSRVVEYVQRVHRAGGELAAVLVDAYDPKQHGGTGLTLDWKRLPAIERMPPIILAGGLRPTNVAEAILAARPAAVDTASGVEIRPGVKDVAAVAAFVAEARTAFQSPAPRSR